VLALHVYESHSGSQQVRYVGSDGVAVCCLRRASDEQGSSTTVLESSSFSISLSRGREREIRAVAAE